jgi:hypothetical protein
MKTLKTLALLALVLGFIAACGGTTDGDTTDQDVVGQETDTTNPDVTPDETDGDAVDPDVVPDETGDDNTETEVSTCEAGQVPLTLDDVTECVSENFAFYATEVLTGTWVQTIPNSQEEVQIEVHRVSSSPFATAGCPGFGYYVQGFDGAIQMCLGEDLSLSMCASNPAQCLTEYGWMVPTGQVTTTDDQYFANFHVCVGGTGGCESETDLQYQKKVE